jgi:tetratricopeptide (TPR) repeat protein
MKGKRLTFKSNIFASWENFVKLICGIAIVLIIIAIIIKAFNISFLDNMKIEVLFITLAVAILLPYIGNFEAFGVKVTIREKVEKLDAWTKALPYYTLGSEYETESDLILAEQYYLKSLNECSTFWPSLVALASVYHDFGDKNKDTAQYSKAIIYYHKALEQNPEDVYCYNNLAALLANAPLQIRNPEEAIMYADKALKIIPSFYDAKYHKAEALNNQRRQENFQQAKEILEGIQDEDEVEYYKHWVLYELCIARSNLGNPVTFLDLESMLVNAEDNDERKLFTKYLKNTQEQQRFSSMDIPTINEFLVKLNESTGN